MNTEKNSVLPDIELTVIKDALTQFSRSGLSANKTWVVNLLIALKSKPLIILFGPPESLKETIVEGISRILTGCDSYQYQALLGHPWWASQMPNVPVYTRTQSQFNTLILESMIEEARLPKNQNKLFIAELIKISSGELQEYFSEMAFQLKHGQLMRLPNDHFSEPIQFPENLSIIGTMDAFQFKWPDPDLLSQTTIIECPLFKARSSPKFGNFVTNPTQEKLFIKSCIRDTQRAVKKLFALLRGFTSPFLPFFSSQKILEKVLSIHGVNAMQEGFIYLANSWSEAGNGLFHENPKTNLQMAMNFSIIQSLLLPCSSEIASSKNLQARLNQVLQQSFPHASSYINHLVPA